MLLSPLLQFFSLKNTIRVRFISKNNFCTGYHYLIIFHNLGNYQFESEEYREKVILNMIYRISTDDAIPANSLN